MKVRCCNCMWEGDEESLVFCHSEKKPQEVFMGCPYCHTDKFLMDIPEELIECPYCGEVLSLEECEEDPIPMYDAEGNVYIIYYCPNCQLKIYEENIEEDK